MDTDKKTISVVGLDGLGRQYLAKMINSGEMPYLKHIVENADVNTNIYCFPPSTPSSWPSLMSGVNLGKHGIYDFLKYSNGKIRLFNALDLGHPRIHEMMAMLKQPVLMINPVHSYPIIPVSNTMHVISLTFFTPKPVVYPSYLRKYIENYKQYTYKSLNEFFENYISDLEYRLGVIEELTGKYNYRLIWVNFEVPDRLLHLASEQKRYNILDKLVLKRERIIFRKLDKIIKFLSNETDNVAIVSDHGFHCYNKRISINTILYKHGFVKPAEKGLSTEAEEELSKVLLKKNNPQKIIPADNPLIKIARKPIIKPVARLINNLYTKLTKKGIMIEFPDVDHTKSKAFLYSELSFAIIINRKKYNGDPMRIVEIIKRYEGIKHVWLKDEIFSGPYLGELPDIYIYPDFDKGYYIVKPKIYDKIYESRPVLHHHPLGIFIMKDLNEYKLKHKIINNTAVASIIMGWLGIPLSSWIDDKELVARIFGGNVKYTDRYINLWNLNKRIFAARFFKSRK
ncbi:alkaline phosphatase family protein [Staphylothermus hellenicus]|uniref:Type I phosphodiesterase/nucleotide pyrophosphatase n=1 Tax=Staphylothermus hellenicus (strain DSM 12710 / JCM 10830 / BK20S6-10-b1 / P8) TaxID=591019 RepID=D7DA11_STAHD|nr:alkaline phosphatase family protein [Staphylothermus hellenicus]ADI32607.1 type I phosphodiesterase/nucleotide pyrophosphatase [Staphylothermus hellenicus DSM 12710]